MEFVDNTGKPPTASDLQEALDVVRKFRIQGPLTVPPELYVQLANINRLLDYMKLRVDLL